MEHDSISFPLSTPVEAGAGNTLSALTLKMPTLGTFVRHGMPFMGVIESENTGDQWHYSRINVKPMMGFIAECSGVDRDALNKVDGHSVMPLFNTVVGMLSTPAQQRGPGFTLTKAIMTHNGEVPTLNLKAPTVDTFLNAGIPYARVDKVDDLSRDVTEFRFDPRIMAVFLAAMTGIDAISLEAIDGRDVLPLFFDVVRILGN